MSRIGFLLFYLLAMVPTYLLPYFGSNSLLGQTMWATHTQTGGGLMFTGFHAGALIACIFLAWARSVVNGKRTLMALPIIAAMFDMVPLLSIIPLVPTVLHIITLVWGFDESDELESLDDVASPARHPILMLLLIGGMTFLGSFLVAGAATAPFVAKDLSAAVGSRPSPAASATASAPPAPTSAPQPAGPEKPQWEIGDYKDEMRETRTVYAALASTNKVNLDFPYAGEQPLTLTVRRMDTKDGASKVDVLLVLSKGQILCSRFSCPLTIKFDGEAPSKWEGLEPENHQSNAVFISQPQRFATRLKTAKRIIVEVPLYRAGNEQFTFEPPSMELPPKQ